jgi:hypothetical protein
MGFTRQRKVYRLRFDDEEMAGLVVRARSVPLGAFLDMLQLMDIEIDAGKVSGEDALKLDQLFERFSKALVEWNLEEPEGVPVPATFEGLKSQDIDFTMLIIRAWIAALSQVPDFLPPGSFNGERSLELSMPMEPRSQSPPN